MLHLGYFLTMLYQGCFVPISRISLPSLSEEGRNKHTSRSLFLLRLSGNMGQHESVQVRSRVDLNSEADGGKQVLCFTSFKMIDCGGRFIPTSFPVVLRIHPLATAFEARRAVVERWPSGKVTKEHIVINEKAGPRSGLELLANSTCCWCH